MAARASWIVVPSQSSSWVVEGTIPLPFHSYCQYRLRGHTQSHVILDRSTHLICCVMDSLPTLLTIPLYKVSLWMYRTWNNHTLWRNHHPKRFVCSTLINHHSSSSFSLVRVAGGRTRTGSLPQQCRALPLSYSSHFVSVQIPYALPEPDSTRLSWPSTVRSATTPPLHPCRHKSTSSTEHS